VIHMQGMAYELARELISSRIGNVSHAIGIEESKSEPRRDLITELEAQIAELARERESLVPEGDEQVRSVIVRYSRKGEIPSGFR
jgi:hypothetical protein